MYVPFDQLPPSARVWIYQASEPFSENTAGRIREAAAAFAEQWTAHDQSLKASAEVRHNLFLIFAVDESHNDASGCSMDKKVRFVKELEAAYGISFFDRMRMAWIEGGKVHVDTFAGAGSLLRSGELTSQTRVFNNLVSTKRELDEQWETPLADSWHVNLLQTA
jgi:hypothetical protein